MTEHVGFANFDLRCNGLPEIEITDGGDLILEFDPIAVSGLPPNAGWAFIYDRAVTRLSAVFGPHGFKAVELVD